MSKKIIILKTIYFSIMTFSKIDPKITTYAGYHYNAPSLYFKKIESTVLKKKEIKIGEMIF